MPAEHKPVFRWSLQSAIETGDVASWRDSYRENCDCARAIERAIAEHYHDNTLDDGTAPVLERYGFNRVHWILANTVQEKSKDGRISDENKAWAKSFYIPEDDVRWHFCVESHPGLTDLFLDQVREAWQRLGLFDGTACSEEPEYARQVLVLRPEVLKDEYKHPEYQLFLAQSGFGCAAAASGRAVFGRFLIDGESARFNRGDFLGVIRDECLPEWASEKLSEWGVSPADTPKAPSMDSM